MFENGNTMISLGSSSATLGSHVSSPLFKITIENTGQIGQDSFELWLSLENRSENDVTFTKSFVSLFYHYGNWCSGLPLQTSDPLPTALLAGQKLWCCLHIGNSLPLAKNGHSGWMHGGTQLKGLEDYVNLRELMNDDKIEIEAQFHFQTDRLKHSNFIKEWFASRDRFNQKICKILSVSCALKNFKKTPYIAKSVERSG